MDTGAALVDLDRIRPISRKEAVIETLRHSIIEGRLKPGERLDAVMIAAQLGCSRMPVRDALKELEAEGLVSCFPSRGTEVSRLDAHDLEQLFGIRLALEVLALRRAVVAMTPADLAELSDIIQAMEAAPTLQLWLGFNERFHGCINHASGWPRLVAEIERQRRNIGRYVRERIRLEGRDLPDEQHRAMFEACRARDADRAAAILEHHLMHTAALLGRNAPPPAETAALTLKGA